MSVLIFLIFYFKKLKENEELVSYACFIASQKGRLNFTQDSALHWKCFSRIVCLTRIFIC